MSRHTLGNVEFQALYRPPAPLAARGRLPDEYRHPLTGPAAPFRPLEQRFSPLPTLVPAQGPGTPVAGRGRRTGGPESGASGLLPHARPCQCGQWPGRAPQLGRLPPDQAGNTPQVEPLLEGLHPGHVLADRAYDSDPLRSFIVAQGRTGDSRPAPPQDTHRPRPGAVPGAQHRGTRHRLAQTVPPTNHALREDRIPATWGS